MNDVKYLRVAIQQRVLPAYRVTFFDLLAKEFEHGLDLLAGQPADNESLGRRGVPEAARLREAGNIHIGRGRLYACFQKNLLIWLEAVQPDVLIVEANPRNLSTSSAITWMHKRDRCVIGWGLGAQPRASAWLTTLRRRLLLSADALITYSRLGAEQYAAQGYNRERIFLAPNAAAMRPAGEPPHREDTFLHGKAGLLYVGRLQKRKKLDVLLHACAMLPEKQQPSLTITGDGPASAELRQLAEKVYPAARFTGELYGEDLAREFRGADLFALPGTGGLAVQQAMTYALPVVVGEADGTQSNLVRPLNGWQLQSGDAEELARVLMDALSDAARLRRMGNESFRIVREEVNLEEMVRGFTEAIQAVSGKR